MANGWTPERRAKQAEAIRGWKPWERSTGPKTEAGKTASSMNAEKHGMRGREAREFEQEARDFLRACRERLVRPEQ